MTMTAVAVQQHAAHRQQYSPRQSPHSSNMSSAQQSRPGSYSSSSAAQIQRQETPLQNGSSGTMNPRPAVSNDPVPVANGSRSTAADTSASVVRTEASTSDFVDGGKRRASLQARPTSAPNGAGETSESETDRSRRRRPKLLLQRSKSDYGPRGEDQDSQADEEIQDWGARHGFEDHYASEEYVSQLANVSRPFLFSRPSILGPCLDSLLSCITTTGLFLDTNPFFFCPLNAPICITLSLPMMAPSRKAIPLMKRTSTCGKALVATAMVFCNAIPRA